MHHALKIKTLALVLMAGAFAFAQVVNGDGQVFQNIDLAKQLLEAISTGQEGGFGAFFVNEAALAGVVLVVVAVVKQFTPQVQDRITVLVAVAVGAVLGGAGQLLGLYDGTLLAALAFGAGGGIFASGGRQVVLDSLLKVVNPRAYRGEPPLESSNPVIVTGAGIAARTLTQALPNLSEEGKDLVSRLVRETGSDLFERYALRGDKLDVGKELLTLAGRYGGDVVGMVFDAIQGKKLTPQQMAKFSAEMEKQKHAARVSVTKGATT